MKKIDKMVCLAALSIFALSCGKEVDDYGDRDCIRIMMDPSGIGDGGYNDLIYKGAVGIWSQYGKRIPVSIATPDDLAHAEDILGRWLMEIDREDGGKHLIVFASAVYEGLCLEAAESADPKAVDMVLFESDYDGELPVHCFSTSLYGASWIAGAVAADAGAKFPVVVMANGVDGQNSDAAEGFRDGYSEGCRSGGGSDEARDLECIYLRDSAGEGYDCSLEAYQGCSLWVQSHDFIFPVAGGSNSGVYHYLREHPKGVYTVGMDSDKSRECSAVMMNVIKRMDVLVEDVLQGWIKRGELPANEVYGLESGYVDCTVSFNYTDYIESYMDGRKDEGIRKDNEFIGSR
ncbi:MAG: BMP family ABC transporter substrate-binding protein [Candidatus Cryptobacteroides sp.]